MKAGNFAWFFILILLLMIFVSGCVSETGRIPPGASSVAQLLEDPVYDTEITTYGKVSLLGELFCPCFELTSGGRKMTVWYGLMAKGEGEEWPAVSVEGIRNGDWVLVRGELKSAIVSAPGVEPVFNFWARSIQKTLP
jgi:hypothetical protein